MNNNERYATPKLKFIPSQEACPKKWNQTQGEQHWSWWCAQNGDGSWFWYQYAPTLDKEGKVWIDPYANNIKSLQKVFYCKTEPEEDIYSTSIYMGTMEHTDDANRRQYARMLEEYEKFYGPNR